jgi:hypothetical protein
MDFWPGTYRNGWDVLCAGRAADQSRAASRPATPREVSIATEALLVAKKLPRSVANRSYDGVPVGAQTRRTQGVRIVRAMDGGARPGATDAVRQLPRPGLDTDHGR